MGFIAWIIIGGLAGWLAGIIMKDPSGLIMNIVIGIVGAFIGGWLFGVLGISPDAGFIGSLVTAIVGAVVLLFGLRLVKGR
ncbi:MAG: GlsB/YeaQ/YmgE family stress response membrane protein [Rhizobiaceae bacterium]